MSQNLLQYLGLFIVIAANAYSDGLKVRRLVYLFDDVNRELMKARSSASYQAHIRMFEWTALQWLWHVLKWIHFNLVLFYIVKVGWQWPNEKIALSAIVAFLVWSFIYRTDKLYPTSGELGGLHI